MTPESKYDRYSRQMRVPGIGKTGQERIMASRLNIKTAAVAAGFTAIVAVGSVTGAQLKASNEVEKVRL